MAFFNFHNFPFILFVINKIMDKNNKQKSLKKCVAQVVDRIHVRWAFQSDWKQFVASRRYISIYQLSWSIVLFLWIPNIRVNRRNIRRSTRKIWGAYLVFWMIFKSPLECSVCRSRFCVAISCIGTTVIILVKRLATINWRMNGFVWFWGYNFRKKDSSSLKSVTTLFQLR